MHAAAALRPTVLVVEDEANIRELVCLHLGLEEVASEQAATGHAGLDLARSKKFDLVILDLMLPGLDGVTVCKAIPARFAERRHADSDAHGGRESPTKSSASTAGPTIT
jgi:CheY-like chemotaxis protein